jgi:hypothetical protein
MELYALSNQPSPSSVGDLTRAMLVCAMMNFRTVVAFLLTLGATAIFAGEPSPKDVVTQLYKAYGTEQSSAGETRLFTRYFDDKLLKLYLKDKREAKGEVGRLDGDPLYNAQEVQITDFSISEPNITGGDALVTVRFKNIGKPVRVEYVLRRTAHGWKISDIRYDDGNSLKKILQGPL